MEHAAPSGSALPSPQADGAVGFYQGVVVAATSRTGLLPLTEARVRRGSGVLRSAREFIASDGRRLQVSAVVWRADADGVAVMFLGTVPQGFASLGHRI